MTDADLERAMRTWNEMSMRTRYIQFTNEKDHSELAKHVESDVRTKLFSMGYHAVRTGNNDPFDLLVNACRIEVKAATWSGQRYQANFHNNDADILIMGCMNNKLHYFVIPFSAVYRLTYIKITSHDPSKYTGHWINFYEAWTVVDDIVNSNSNPWQLPLFLV